MLVFDEGGNRSYLWKKVHEKMGEITHSGHFRVTCTGTPCTCTGTLWVMVIFGRVPVHVRPVPVHPALVFLF